jgi:thiosulfate/3-mercaptopyruvate sulfurtransferase
MRVLVFLIAVLLTGGAAADLALIQPNELAAQLAAQTTHSQITPYGPLLIIQVGPNVLYRSKHIPRAMYAGPASRPEGLELLKKAVEKLPREREIIVYCGCCPWGNCPNVKPAMSLLKEMGFTNAKAMYVETSFAKDWIDKGHPVESGTPK